MHDDDLPAADTGVKTRPKIRPTSQPRRNQTTFLLECCATGIGTFADHADLDSGHLPDFRTSEHERRGDMGKARIWRIDFFRRSVAELLVLALDRGLVPTTARFWRQTFRVAGPTAQTYTKHLRCWRPASNVPRKHSMQSQTNIAISPMEHFAIGSEPACPIFSRIYLVAAMTRTTCLLSMTTPGCCQPPRLS